jgi:hypothetical protein
MVSLKGKSETGALAEGDHVRSILPGFRSPLELLPLIYSAIDAAICFLLFQVPGPGGQVSGAGVQVRAQVRENPVPEPGADDLNLGPDGRDQRPEN